MNLLQFDIHTRFCALTLCSV